MHEDRVILESVLARNRDAILDLHNLTNTISRNQSKLIERAPSRTGDHHRQLSEAAGVQIPPIPDVLPLTIAEMKEQDSKDTPPKRLGRTFSKRGVRLGVHMSILDLSAHEAPTGLKKKWIQQAHLRQQYGHRQPGNRGGLTALPELSRISEVDTVAGSSTNLNLTHVQSQIEPIIPFIPESPLAQTPTGTAEVPFSTPAGLTPINSNGSTTRSTRASTVSTKLRRVMSKLSINSLVSPTRNRSQARRSSEISISASAKGKEREDTSHTSERSSSKQTQPAKQDMEQENRPLRKMCLEMVRHRFERSPITTPDIEREFEFNRP